jgi:hypothetical protein
MTYQPKAYYWPEQQERLLRQIEGLGYSPLEAYQEGLISLEELKAARKAELRRRQKNA